MHRSRITGKSKMPKIPSLALGKKGKLSKFMNWDRISKKYIYKKKGGGGEDTSVPSLVLAQETTGYLDQNLQ